MKKQLEPDFNSEESKLVYIKPNQELIDELTAEWAKLNTLIQDIYVNRIKHLESAILGLGGTLNKEKQPENMSVLAQQEEPSIWTSPIEKEEVKKESLASPIPQKPTKKPYKNTKPSKSKPITKKALPHNFTKKLTKLNGYDPKWVLSQKIKYVLSKGEKTSQGILTALKTHEPDFNMEEKWITERLIDLLDTQEVRKNTHNEQTIYSLAFF